MSGINNALGLLQIPVNDLRLCADYYRDVLGFAEEFVVEQYGWAHVRAGNVPLSLNRHRTDGEDGQVGGRTGFQLSLAATDFVFLAEARLARGTRN